MSQRARSSTVLLAFNSNEYPGGDDADDNGDDQYDTTNLGNGSNPRSCIF